ncbi:hypothetical protein BP5796_07718 [Coleophoma crateriformis]|uniref:Uncharacterized protein n=1 Tax=Coleophoma crateriformis TaxID=565419 RepID=A0A3D8RCT5_9HELO|nr:hypothetical protein BP5796_07718 [Coleophoma crateriformis]
MAAQVALITAGSAGLGAATARLFASQGLRVIVNYSNNRARADALVQELHTLSPLPSDGEVKNFIAIQADLGKREEIARLVEEAVQAMGKLDVVFSNAGWTRVVPFLELDENVNEEDWDRCYLMNVKSHLWLCHASRKYLEATEGCFITTASCAGIKPSGSSLAYSVTKAAQIHLVKGLAKSCAPKIRVNSVSPSLMMTDWGLSFPQASQDAAREATVLKKFVTVEDVAQQVLCFARSKTVTGVNSVLDAGFTL